MSKQPGLVLPSLQSQPVVGVSNSEAATEEVRASQGTNLIDLLGKYRDPSPEANPAGLSKVGQSERMNEVSESGVESSESKVESSESKTESAVKDSSNSSILTSLKAVKPVKPVVEQVPVVNSAPTKATKPVKAMESVEPAKPAKSVSAPAKPAKPVSASASALPVSPPAPARPVSPIPDLDKPKVKQRIAAKTYEGEGTLLDEGSSSDEEELVPIGVSTKQPIESNEQEDIKVALTTDTISIDESESEYDEPEDIAGSPEGSTTHQIDRLTVVDPEPTDPTEPKSIHRVATSTSLKVPIPPEDGPKSSFDFQEFLTQFKSPDCEPVHRYLKSFLSQFSHRNWTVDEQVKLVKDFEEFIFNKLCEHFPFNTMQTDAEISNCKEGIEKLVMTRLYSQVFSPVVNPNKLSDGHRRDRMLDRKFARNVRLYDWVQLRHLDVPTEIDPHSKFFQLAAEELNKINNYKSPRDKVICVLNCCKIIFGLIRQQQKQHNIEENADSFVPLLICVLFQAKTKWLHSNIVYIERYRGDEFLVGETSYYVSTLQIACNFITDITRDKLTVSDEEYDREMAASKERLKDEIQRRDAQRRANSPGAVLPKKLTDLIQHTTAGESPSNVLHKSAEIMKQSLSNSFNTLFQPEESDEAEHADRQSTHPATQFSDLQATAEQIEQIKKLSLAEHKHQVEARQKQDENYNTLAAMFPDTDKEIIQDVLSTTINEDGSNIGDCVDVLLTLSN